MGEGVVKRYLDDRSLVTKDAFRAMALSCSRSSSSIMSVGRLSRNSSSSSSNSSSVVTHWHIYYYTIQPWICRWTRQYSHPPALAHPASSCRPPAAVEPGRRCPWAHSSTSSALCGVSCRCFPLWTDGSSSCFRVSHCWSSGDAERSASFSLTSAWGAIERHGHNTLQWCWREI